MSQTVTIIVNTRPKTVHKEEITFEEIVHLAYDNPPTGPNWVFTVTYHRGQGNKPEGSLRAGESVKVKEGMVFDVTATDKS
jgi:Multiubiquitin